MITRKFRRAAPTAVEAARKYVGKSLNEAARWMEDGRSFVMGEHFGTADILLASCLAWASLYGISLPASLSEYFHMPAHLRGSHGM